MSCSYLFIPRMNLKISNCFVNEEIENFSKLNFCYFNPLDLSLANSCQNPQFVMSQSEARHFMEEISKIVSDRNYDLKTDKVLAGVQNIREQSNLEKQWSAEEAQAIEAFADNNSDDVQIDLTENKVNHQEDYIQKQKKLLVAKLQEEQDLDLYLLEKKISVQDSAIQSLLNNPHENNLTTENVNSYLQEDSLSNNFPELSQNILKNKTNKKDLAEYVISTLDVVNIKFSNHWKEIFFTQLSFIQENPLLIVNDREMSKDLFSLKSNSATIFLNDLRTDLPPNYRENQNLLIFQDYCKKNNLHFCLLTTFIEVLYSGKVLQFENKKLDFLIPYKLLEEV